MLNNTLQAGGITLGEKGIKIGVQAAVIAMLVIIAAFSVFLALEKSGEDSSDNGPYYDPLIQGDYGLGTTFTYDLVDVKEDGISAPFDPRTIVLEIIGQSGSYYMLGFGIENPMGMTHKKTGEVRFSENVGIDSINFDGNDIALEKWEIVMLEQSDLLYKYGQSYTISSCADDAIPYKISLKTEYYSFSAMSGGVEEYFFELTSFSIVTPTEYVPSGAVGKGYVYEYEIFQEEYAGFGTVDIVCIAENQDAGILFAFQKADVKGVMNLSVIQFSPYSDTSTLCAEFFPLGTLVGEVTIDTIDGPMVCDLYEDDSEIPMVEKVYVGQSNGVIYLAEQYYDGVLREQAKLIAYIG